MSEFEGTEREKAKPSRTPERKMQDGAGRQAGVTSWEPREAPAGFDPVKFPDQAHGGQGLPKARC